MTPEALVLNDVASYIFLVAPLLGMAFSPEVRKLIGRRDHWVCQWEGCDDGTGQPKSFRNGWWVEAAHHDHDRKQPDYNTPQKGQILCLEHHLQQHREHEGDNGLTHEQNEWAIRALQKKDDRTRDYREHPEKYGI